MFLSVAKSVVGLPLFFGVGIINFRSSSIFCIMLDDCTCLQHLQTTKFKELRKMHNLPFVSALGHFFFPNFPLTSLTKIPSKFLFSTSSYFKQIKTDKNDKYV